jgi:hypothetical protein
MFSRKLISNRALTTLNKDLIYTALNDSLTSFPSSKFSTRNFTNPFYCTLTFGTNKLLLTRRLLAYEILLNYMLRPILTSTKLNILSSNKQILLYHTEYEFRIEILRKKIIAEAIVIFKVEGGKVTGNDVIMTYPTYLASTCSM